MKRDFTCGEGHHEFTLVIHGDRFILVLNNYQFKAPKVLIVNVSGGTDFQLNIRCYS